MGVAVQTTPTPNNRCVVITLRGLALAIIALVNVHVFLIHLRKLYRHLASIKDSISPVATEYNKLSLIIVNISKKKCYTEKNYKSQKN